MRKIDVWRLCIQLAHGTFELTNQDSAGKKNFTVLVLCKLTREALNSGNFFLVGDGIRFS